MKQITPEEIMRADRLWVSWVIHGKNLTLDERNELEELQALCKPIDHKEVLFKHYEQANARIKELEANVQCHIDLNVELAKQNVSLQAKVDVMLEALNQARDDFKAMAKFNISGANVYASADDMKCISILAQITIDDLLKEIKGRG